MTVTIGKRTDGTPAWLGDSAGRCWLTLVSRGMPDDGITDAGRTEQEQAAMWARYLAGRLKATAARPNTPEAHHQDMPPDGAHAVDATGDTQEWLIAWAPSCWSRPLLRATHPEAWHWEHDAALCTTTIEEDDMPTAQEIAAAVWNANLGPLDAVPAGPAWLHLVATRSVAAGQLPAITAHVAALEAAVAHLATGQGADPAAVLAAARQGATDALKGVQVTITTPAG